MSAGQVEIKITADATEAQKSIKQLSTSVDELSGKESSLGSSSGTDALNSSLSTAAATAAGTATAMDDVASGAGAAEGAADSLSAASANLDTSMGTLKTSVEGVGTKLSSAFKVGATAAVAGIGAITTKATEAFADYEQLVGGVETLFGSSSDKLMEYAESAYTTAGLSANEYMEQSTSFAASLISSLGGDTDAAVEAANTAMVDMSDNANKMGTDVECIQDAYQGFAKQNYTMLDNLKLGYGGTKTEMERLISDANEIAVANGEAGDLTIDSYADVVEAIHIVQTEMGITGTTSEEAATTIQGSVSSMQAAWENWLTALGSEDMDVGEYTDKLLESIGTVLENVEPAVLEVLESLISALPGVVTGLRDELSELIASAIADAWNDAAESLGESLGIELPELNSEDLTGGIQGLLTALAGLALGILAVGAAVTIYNAAMSLAALATSAYEIATNLAKVAQAAFNVVMNANPMVLIATIIAAVVAAIVIFIATNDELREKVQEVFTKVGNKISEVVKGAKSALTTLVDKVKGIPKSFKEFVTNVIANIKSLPSKLKEKAKEAGTALVNALKDKITSAVNTVKGLPNKAKNALGTLTSTLKQKGKDLIAGFIQGVKDKISTLGDTIKGVASTAKSTICKALGINSPSKVFMEYGRYTIDGYVQGVKSSLSSVKNTMGLVSDMSTLDVTHSLGASYPAYAAAASGATYNTNKGTNIYVDGIQASPDSQLYSLLGNVVDAAKITNKRRRV